MACVVAAETEPTGTAMTEAVDEMAGRSEMGEIPRYSIDDLNKLHSNFLAPLSSDADDSSVGGPFISIIKHRLLTNPIEHYQTVLRSGHTVTRTEIPDSHAATAVEAGFH